MIIKHFGSKGNTGRRDKLQNERIYLRTIHVIRKYFLEYMKNGKTIRKASVNGSVPSGQP